MSEIVLTLLYIAGAIMLLALALTFVRFVIGPSLTDRTIAFDVLTVGSLGLMGLIALFENRQIYLDVNIIYGLLSFVAVVVVGKYLRKTL
ncbi:MAG: monovalent cation/H+ antiporter complex subunit F [Bacteroidota bacterium]